MLEIKDSVAVITGGTGGIGLALARYWLSMGGKVLLADVAVEALEKAERGLGGYGRYGLRRHKGRGLCKAPPFPPVFNSSQNDFLSIIPAREIWRRCRNGT